MTSKATGLNEGGGAKLYGNSTCSGARTWRKLVAEGVDVVCDKVKPDADE